MLAAQDTLSSATDFSTTTAGGQNGREHFDILPSTSGLQKCLGPWQEDFYTPLVMRLKTLQSTSQKNQDHHRIKTSLDLGRFFYFCLANCRRIAGEFLSEFRW